EVGRGELRPSGLVAILRRGQIAGERQRGRVVVGNLEEKDIVRAVRLPQDDPQAAHREGEARGVASQRWTRRAHFHVSATSTMVGSTSQPSFSNRICSIATALLPASRSGKAWNSETQHRCTM